MPDGVPGGTATSPVAGSSAGTGAPSVAGTAGVVMVAVTLVKSTGAVLNVSLVKALTNAGLPVAPFTFGGLSLVATKGAAITLTVSVAVLQLVGFRISHRV